MFEFHRDTEKYFDYQYQTSRDYIIPFIHEYRQIAEVRTVLEIGCGEAGVLKAFLEIGCLCVGIELSQARLESAQRLLSEEKDSARLTLINRDIYDVDPESDLPFKFDLIILKDVIEHIPRQAVFVPMLRQFLNPGGLIFFGFPPWQMPFGGHQQIAISRILSKWPYIHLLPRGLYSSIIRAFRESPEIHGELLEIKHTGLSIERFERILKRSDMHFVRRTLWLLNPIYKFKFGKGPLKQVSVLGAIPFLRNFITTAVYYLVCVNIKSRDQL